MDTKKELADYGYQRFGISKSRLMGMSKANILKTLAAAEEHEATLITIAKVARKTKQC